MTNIYKIIIIYILFILLGCEHHHNEIVKIIKNVNGDNYIDFVIANNRIWGLSSSGSVVIFTLDSLSVVKRNFIVNSDITTIIKDRKGNVVIGNRSNEIFRYNINTKKWTKIYQSKFKIIGFIFDKHNNLFIIIPEGILNTNNNIIYKPDDYPSPQFEQVKEWKNPSSYKIDNNDNIWIGFDFGEWGGAIVFFDTKNGRYLFGMIRNKGLSTTGITDFAVNYNRVYISSGSNHMSSTSGLISEYINLNYRKVYTGSNIKRNIPFHNEEEYIGALYFNEANNCLYYYSQLGFFKLTFSKNFENIISRKKILSIVHFFFKSDLAIQQSINNISKFEVINDNKIVMLSRFFGIGLLNDNILRFYK